MTKNWQFTAYGLEVHVQPAGDRPHRQALFAQAIDLLVPPPGIRDPHRVRTLQHGQARRFVGGIVRGRRRGFGQAGVVRGDQPFHVPGQVVPQVPPFGDLHSVGCAVPGAVSIGEISYWNCWNSLGFAG